MKKHKNQLLFIGGVIVLALAGLLLFGNNGATMETTEAPDGEYDTFAQCLYDSGMRMYGSATCAFCNKQKKMFGPSAAYIQEIECDPRNALPQTERCIAKNIAHTPTWIHEDTEGNEIFRFEAGVQSLETLSETSGCPLEKDVETPEIPEAV